MAPLSSNPVSNPCDGDPAADHPSLSRLDRFLAAPMWFAALAFLVCTTGALQDLRGGYIGWNAHHVCWFGILVLWPLFPIEWGLHILAGSGHRWHHLTYCIIPPLRMGGRDHATWRSIWMPRLGWRKDGRHKEGWHQVGRALVTRIEKLFGGPMIVIALMILPLLGIEWFWRETVDAHPWFKFSLDTATSVIWFAFAFELIIMVSIARKKIAYCIEHWIDVAIVILPFIAFMRAFRLLQLSRVEYVGRALRVYHVRGMALRAYRAILLLNVVRRLAQINPEKRLLVLKERLEDQQLTIEATQNEIREVEARIAAEREQEEVEEM